GADHCRELLDEAEAAAMAQPTQPRLQAQQQLLVLAVAFALAFTGGFAGLARSTAGGAVHCVTGGAAGRIAGDVACPGACGAGHDAGHVTAFAALATRVPGCAAELVIGRVVVVRVTWIATLGAVAHALVAVLLLLAVPFAGSAADKAGPGDRHCGLREDVTGKRSTGERDGGTRENRPDEVRVRHRRRLCDPPIHVAGHSASGHDDRETGARESTGANSPDLEDPGSGRGTVERQRAGQSCRGVEAVDTRRERDAGGGDGEGLGARVGGVCGVCRVEVGYNPSGDRRDGRSVNGAAGLDDRR